MRRSWMFLLFVPAILMLAGCSPHIDGASDSAALSQKEEDDAGATEAAPPSPTPDQVDDETARMISSYGATIRQYAGAYGLDWRLVLAVMKQESRFCEEAESHKGATGLMQIMPETGAEVAKALRIENLAHPKNNIRGGIFYLSRLYRLFDEANERDRLQLALAAYNSGLTRIQDAQELAEYFDEDPGKWDAVRDALPYLSKRYYTLHKNVWPQEKPRAGWFGNSRETVTYVENIMAYYDDYRGILN